MNDCIFCRIAAGEIPSRKICEDERTLCFMDIAGDVDGHLLVIPKNHCDSVFDCDPEDLAAVVHTVQRVCRHLAQDCGYDGANLLNASGVSAGQSVPHFHMHIVPRKTGDGFSTWPNLPGAKEDLGAMHEKLRME